MTAAAFGLLGVVIGAALNMLSGLVLAGRRDRREARTAARLVLFEVEEIVETLTRCLEERVLPTGLGIGRWQQYESLLAAELDDDAWRSLSGTYRSLALFEDEAAYGDGRVASSDDLAHLRLTLSVATDALDSLSRRTWGMDRAEHYAQAGPLYENLLKASEREYPDDPV